MDPTGSERRGTPTLGAVFVMLLIGTAALSYDNIVTPQNAPVVATANTQQTALGALAPAECKPGTQPADQQCTASYDYTCKFGTPASQCPQKKPGGLGKPCSEPAGGQSTATITGTCQCALSCKTTPSGGGSGSPPSLPQPPSSGGGSGGGQPPPTTPTTCGQPGADPSTCTPAPIACGQTGADPSTCSSNTQLGNTFTPTPSTLGPSPTDVQSANSQITNALGTTPTQPDTVTAQPAFSNPNLVQEASLTPSNQTLNDASPVTNITRGITPNTDSTFTGGGIYPGTDQPGVTGGIDANGNTITGSNAATAYNAPVPNTGGVVADTGSPTTNVPQPVADANGAWTYGPGEASAYAKPDDATVQQYNDAVKAVNMGQTIQAADTTGENMSPVQQQALANNQATVSNLESQYPCLGSGTCGSLSSPASNVPAPVAAANGGWVEPFGGELSAAYAQAPAPTIGSDVPTTATTDGGIVPGTDQPGVKADVNAQGQPIAQGTPPTNPDSVYLAQTDENGNTVYCNDQGDCRSSPGQPGTPTTPGTPLDTHSEYLQQTDENGKTVYCNDQGDCRSSPPGQSAPTQQSGAPSNPHSEYLQQTDQNGKTVYCNDLGDCRSSPPGQAAPGPGTTKTTTGPTGGTPGGGTPGGGGTGGGTGGGSGSGSGSGLGALGSFLSGLLKGLATPSAPSAPAAAPAQACSTDPNTYAQQQQQYQTALQQYNYQLQQYQYQQQVNQYNSTYYGTLAIPPTPPQQPSPCSPSTAQQCGSTPAQPAASTCNAGSWQPVYSGSCITNWQCSGAGGADLGAQLSCSPSVADVGSTLSLSYSCAQGTASGSGFTASGQSGTATAVVAAPPQGANTATYALTCSDGTNTSGAQCSVQVAQPSIVFVANPATISSGQTSLLGWVTTGMQSCVISSPQNATFTAQNSSNTSSNGSVDSGPLTTSSEFDLSCTTITGKTSTAKTTVVVSGTPLPSGGTGSGTSSITATSTADGGTVNHGDTATISWQSTNEPSGSVVALWLLDVHQQTATALIAGNLPLSGSYTWSVPAAASACPSDGSFNVCGNDLIAGRQYVIEADVYSPADAYVGDGPPPSSPVAPVYGDFFDDTAFTVGN